MHAGGDREAGVPEGVHARRAVVLDARHRPAEELQGVGERVAAEAETIEGTAATK
jgi:hypothetical protein